MSYSDRYGSTKIRDTKVDNLQISRDDMGEGVIPVLLYTPHMNHTKTHFHIELSKAQAAELYTWLGQYLMDDERTEP